MTSLRVRSPASCWASALLRCGISMPIVEHRRWMGQWLGSPAERYSSEVVRFVFEERQIEAALAPLDVPGTCGPLMASDGHGLPGTCGLETNHSYDLPHDIDKFRHIDSWFVTGTCGVPTCGLDVAVVRDHTTGALQVRSPLIALDCP